MAIAGYPAEFERSGNAEQSFISQREYIQRLHAVFNNHYLNTQTKLEVFDNHGAYLRYKKDTDTIAFDTHFLDYLRMVSAVLLTDDFPSMDIIADAYTADYLICKGELTLAEQYAKLFAAQKSRLEEAVADSQEETKLALNRQLLFLLHHEQGHGLLHRDPDDGHFLPFRYHFRQELERLNEESNSINSIDLTPIKAELDALDRGVLEDTFDYSQQSIERVERYALQLRSVIEKGLDLIEIPEQEELSEVELLYYACDRYLKTGGKVPILEGELYEDDCIIDGFCLQQLVSVNFDEEQVVDKLKDTVFSYYSCLLTTNIISCVNSCLMNDGVQGYMEEDLVWNRLRLEWEILNQIIRQYCFRLPRGVALAEEVFAYAVEMKEKYDLAYARLCDRRYGVKDSDLGVDDCIYGSKAFDEKYRQVQRLLAIDLKV